MIHIVGRNKGVRKIIQKAAAIPVLVHAFKKSTGELLIAWLEFGNGKRFQRTISDAEIGEANEFQILDSELRIE